MLPEKCHASLSTHVCFFLASPFFSLKVGRDAYIPHVPFPLLVQLGGHDRSVIKAAAF